MAESRFDVLLRTVLPSPPCLSRSQPLTHIRPCTAAVLATASGGPARDELPERQSRDPEGMTEASLCVARDGYSVNITDYLNRTGMEAGRVN